MLPYDIDDLERELDHTYLARGKAYFKKGHVLDAGLSPDGTRIFGRIKGSRRQPYEVDIEILTHGAEPVIDGTCTCPMGYNCKHVAAVMLHVLNYQKPATPQAVPTGHSAPNGFSLGAEIQGWLDGLSADQDDTDPDAYPDTVHQRLIYILFPGSASSRQTEIQFVSVRLLKSGSFGANRKRLSPTDIAHDRTSLFLRPVDIRIATEFYLGLHRTQGYVYGSRQTLLDNVNDPAVVLQEILATGRCRLASLDGIELRPGPPRKAAFAWTQNPDGSQSLSAKPLEMESDRTSGPIDDVLPIAPPFYVDRQSGTCGPLDFGIAPRLAAQIASAPPVLAREADLVAGQLSTFAEARGLAAILPQPENSRPVETRNIKPVPVLKLLKGAMKYDAGYFDRRYRSYYYRDGPYEKVTVPLARLAHDYSGQSAEHGDERDVLEIAEPDRIIVTPRDFAAEAEARQILADLGFQRTRNVELLTTTKAHGDDFFLMPDELEIATNDAFSAEEFLGGQRFIKLSGEIVPWLAEDKGWRVEFSADYPYRIAEGSAEFWADIESGSGIDWFSFALGFEFEGQKFNLLPTLVELISVLPADLSEDMPTDELTEFLQDLFNDMNSWHELPDGRLLPLPGDRMASIVAALLELAGPDLKFAHYTGAALKLSPLDASALAAFEEQTGDANLNWRGQERVAELAKKLRAMTELPRVEAPGGLGKILRDYQRDGLNWLAFLQEAGFGGVLADDMGLGKTLQVLSFVLNEKLSGRLEKPVLIVSPTSVLSNWQAEALKFTPELSVLPLRGPQRAERFGEMAGHDIVLTTYPLLSRDKDTLLEQNYHSVILDEAQAIKNPKAAVSVTACQLKADGRFALSGTPLENNLGDVWSLFNFLNPGFLGDTTAFRRTYRTPIEKHGDMPARSHLARRLKPFLLRRTKDEVALELPSKTEIIEYVELEAGQRDLYETVRLMMDKRVREAIDSVGMNRSHIIVLDALLKLRQVCCDPRLVKTEAAKKVSRSAKLQRLRELLPEMVAEGRCILLFSQFTSMLALIEAELAKLGIDYVTLTGNTKDRDAPINAFQSGDVPVFLISLKAGGTGLNLTAADTVIHYDPWWNPAVENQATDRAHRIGQDKPVFVHKLMVKNSLEEAIEQLKQRKSELAAALFAEKPSGKFALTEADLEALFAPMV